jgi:hypothetical protein
MLFLFQKIELYYVPQCIFLFINNILKKNIYYKSRQTFSAMLKPFKYPHP